MCWAAGQLERERELKTRGWGRENWEEGEEGDEKEEEEDEEEEEEEEEGDSEEDDDNDEEDVQEEEEKEEEEEEVEDGDEDEEDNDDSEGEEHEEEEKDEADGAADEKGETMDGICSLRCCSMVRVRENSFSSTCFFTASVIATNGTLCMFRDFIRQLGAKGAGSARFAMYGGPSALSSGSVNWER
jgi:hypothetical protein